MKIPIKVAVPVEIPTVEIPMLRESLGVLTNAELKARIQEGAADAAQEAVSDYMGRLYTRAERGQ